MIKKIRKVIIPVAGWGTRFLPITKVVPKELLPILKKPVIHYLVEEAVASGIEEIILIISKRKMGILKYFNINAELEEQLERFNNIELLHKIKETNDIAKITVVNQEEQLGMGHAISMAAKITGDEPFGVMLGDDLINSEIPAMKQLMDVYNETGSSVLGVQTVPKEETVKYGTIILGNEEDSTRKIFPIKGVVEKPKISEAPSNKVIFGRYVFTAELMPLLKELKPTKGSEINIIDCFDELMKLDQKILALTFEGKRYDIGSLEGFIKANIDYALENDEVKEKIMEHIKSKL